MLGRDLGSVKLDMRQTVVESCALDGEGGPSVVGGSSLNSFFAYAYHTMVLISDFRLGYKQAGARIRTQNHPPHQQWAHSRRYESEAALKG